MIYADNAATTCVSEAARRAMMAAMETTWGNPSSLYTFGQQMCIRDRGYFASITLADLANGSVPV